MSWLSQFTDDVGTALGAGGSSGTGGGLAGLTSHQATPANPAQEQMNQTRQATYQADQNFKKNLPQYNQQLQNAAQDDVRHSMVNSIAQSNTNLSRRNLVGSGIQQGMNAKMRAMAASDMAKRTYDIGTQTQAMADQYDTQLANLDNQRQTMDLGASNDAYSAMMGRINNQNQQFASGAGMLGRGIGSYYGSQSARPGGSNPYSELDGYDSIY